MRTRPLSLMVLTAALAAPAHAGPLTPPAGPVGPTHKTLTQVEPRTALGSATTPGDGDSVYRITQPGSYYLTGDLAGAPGRHGIEVAAADVTIDLNGFTLRGGNGSLCGIVASGDGLVVRNGRIQHWGSHGVLAVSNFVVEGVRVHIAGGDGITGGQGAIVRGCLVDNAQRGIVCGFDASISGCIASNNQQAGITIGRGVVDGCATANGGIGIIASEAVVTRCTASYNAGDGIRAGAATLVRDCSAHNNGQGPAEGAGIRVVGFGARVEGNSVTENDIGIGAAAGGSVIVRNSAHLNGVAYDIAPGNAAGPVVTPATIATDTNPHANYAL